MMYQPIQASPNMECIICYEPITTNAVGHETEENDQFIHEVHENCIKSWIVYSNSHECPLCKIDINANKIFTLFEKATNPIRYLLKKNYLDILTISSIGITAISTYSHLLESNSHFHPNLLIIPSAVGVSSGLIIHLFQRTTKDHESFFARLCLAQGIKLSYEIIFSISGFFIDSCLEDDLQKLAFQSKNELLQSIFFKTNVAMISLVLGSRVGKTLIQKISAAWQTARQSDTAPVD